MPSKRPRSTKSRRKAAAPTVKLPTAAGLKGLSLPKRAAVLGRWLAEQPRERTYRYTDNHGCALAQFSQAVFRSPHATGGAWTITDRTPTGVERDRIVVVPGGISITLIRDTFGEASDAFHAALAAQS